MAPVGPLRDCQAIVVVRIAFCLLILLQIRCFPPLSHCEFCRQPFLKQLQGNIYCLLQTYRASCSISLMATNKNCILIFIPVYQASSPELGNVVRCRGCLNGFHPGCLAPEEKPAAAASGGGGGEKEGEEERWRCPDCLAGIHPCFLCKLSEGETVPASSGQVCGV